MITSPSLVRQKGGIEFKSIEPYLLLTILESNIATTPRSSKDLIKRPVPWARSRAALGNEICIKPEPPAASACAALAANTGSSGRGNGIRSIATNVQEGPGTSIPCHSEIVPNKIDFSSFANFSTNGATESPLRWVIIGSFKSDKTFLKYSSAASTPRQDENSAKVLPPAA